MSWENALLMKLSNDVESMKLKLLIFSYGALLAISYYRRDYLGTFVSTINILKSTLSVHISIIGYDLT